MAHGVLVSCRVRPLDSSDDADDVISVADTAVRVGEDSAFTFDSVFGPTTTQQELFAAVGEPLVRHVLEGFHCTLLAYGQSGSGKTFTTFGDDGSGEGDGDGDGEGLVPRLLQRLVTACADDVDTTLTASFVEIYQERLVDLLCPTKSSGRLRVREDRATDGVWVDGAAEISLSSRSVARQVVRRGLRNRESGATRLNDRSSRSHAVLTLTLTRTRRADDDASTTTTTTRSRLCVADLAGSESVHKSAAQGQRLEEAKHINRSLSALGNVIHALTSAPAARGYVPYRDSKLTRLLQTALGGNARTHLLLTCSSAARHAEETLSTLRFGARAARMVNAPRVNVASRSPPRAKDEMLRTLEAKLESLCHYIRELESRPPQAWTCARCREIECPPEDDANECPPGDDALADDVMQQELRMLRQALAELQQERQQHVDSPQPDAEQLHVRQAREIEQLELQVNEADAAVAALQAQLREAIETHGAMQQRLEAELRQLQTTLRHCEQASAAESEILRRRVELLERQHQSRDVELSAMRRETDELRSRLARRDAEEKNQRPRDQAARSASVAVVDEPAAAAALSPPRWPSCKPRLRPVTAAGDPAGNALAIHQWWAGDQEDPTESDERSELVAAPGDRERPRRSSRGCRPTPSGNVQLRPLTSNGLSTTRPLRSRLVTLLNTLEEETSAYRALLDPPASSAGGRQDEHPRGRRERERDRQREST
ncbi:hypothetical protein ATCC90586_003507 [Pythium insidiosum]|nr:hypothetical protein ATCC90586_003507 [Pythium insidiosum]